MVWKAIYTVAVQCRWLLPLPGLWWDSWSPWDDGATGSGQCGTHYRVSIAILQRSQLLCKHFFRCRVYKSEINLPRTAAVAHWQKGEESRWGCQWGSRKGSRPAFYFCSLHLCQGRKYIQACLLSACREQRTQHQIYQHELVKFKTEPT